MKKIQRIITALLCMLILSPVWGQEEPTPSQFEYGTYFRMNSNMSFYGELIDMRGDTLEIELASGNRIKLLSHQIRKMEAYDPSSRERTGEPEVRHHLFRDKATPHFFHISSGLIFGGSSDVILSGANMSTSYKNQWRPGHFLVGQVGVDIFDGLFPVLSESLTVGYEWMKFTNRANPFISGKLGWGIAQYLDEDEPTPWWTPPERSIESGYRAMLGMGVALTGKRNSAFSMSVDFIVQQLTYREVFPEVQTRVLDYTHRRIQFNLAYTF